MDGPLLTVRCRIQGKDVGLLDLKYHDEDDFPSHGLSAVQTMVEPERPNEPEEHGSEEQRREPAAATEAPSWAPPTRPSPSSQVSKGAVDSVLSRESISPPEHATQPPKLGSMSPSSNSSTSLPSESKSNSRRSSTSPRPLSTLAFWKRGSKSEQEKEEERLRKEEKKRKEEEEKRVAQEEEERRRRSGQNSTRPKKFELWVPFTDKDGNEMLRNQLTGKVEQGSPKHAEGLGLRGF